MTYILKNNITGLNIKLTSLGRKKLSEGELKFSSFGIGDSEIDYKFARENDFSPSEFFILRPKDINPKIKHIIPANTAETFLNITGNTAIVNNQIFTADELGFFNLSGSTYNIKNSSRFTYQSDAAVNIDTLTGGTILNLRKSSNYGGNLNEISKNQYLLINWRNPTNSGDTINPYEIPLNKPMPYIWYKIEEVLSGSLSGNDLTVLVDRNLPNFSGLTGQDARVFIYPSGNSIQDYYGSSYFSDFWSDGVLNFEINANVPPIEVPVWNMNICYTENIAGISSNFRQINKYDSNDYAGFINYVKDLEVKNIGIIHYSNPTPANVYGDFLVDDTPKLILPTIMWHHNQEIGLTLLSSATTSTGYTLNEILKYYDLVDENQNIVGKVFNDLKIFVIEDQELLFAMSYKSNRNWTLPKPIAGFNLFNCPTICLVNITNLEYSDIGIFENETTLIITAENGIGLLEYSIDSGNTYQLSNEFTITSAGTYNVVVSDTGLENCTDHVEITIDKLTCPTISATFNVTNSEFEENNGQISITASGGNPPYTYSINGDSYTSTNPITDLTPNTYNIIVKDVSGCTSEEYEVVVVEESDPCETFNINITTTPSNDSNGTITITPSGGLSPYSFEISGPSGTFNNTNGNFSGLDSGTYDITVTDANSCIETDSVIVGIDCALSITSLDVTSSDSSSNTGSITVNIAGNTGSVEYRLDNGSWQSSNVFNNLAPDTYNVQVRETSNQTCSANETITVNQLKRIAIQGGNVTNPICVNAVEVLNFLVTKLDSGSVSFTLTFTSPNDFCGGNSVRVNGVDSSYQPIGSSRSYNFNSPITESNPIVTFDLLYDFTCISNGGIVVEIEAEFTSIDDDWEGIGISFPLTCNP
ncbi:MAG: SprB repeat-containing protein [bacterium]